MDRVIDFTQTVCDVVEAYATEVLLGKSYPVSDHARQYYTVVDIPDYPAPPHFSVGISVMARVVGDKVIIDADMTDRPLWEALVQAGIPREQIILAYAGEQAPDAA
jgi:vancomycin permeability regulator SanA